MSNYFIKIYEHLFVNVSAILAPTLFVEACPSSGVSSGVFNLELDRANDSKKLLGLVVIMASLDGS